MLTEDDDKLLPEVVDDELPDAELEYNADLLLRRLGPKYGKQIVREDRKVRKGEGQIRNTTPLKRSKIGKDLK